MVLGGGESEGTVFAEPLALTPMWELKLDTPLKTPHYAHWDYLPTILMGVLENNL